MHAAYGHDVWLVEMRHRLHMLALAVLDNEAMPRVVRIHRQRSSLAVLAGVPTQPVEPVLAKSELAEHLVAQVDNVVLVPIALPSERCGWARNPATRRLPPRRSPSFARGFHGPVIEFAPPGSPCPRPARPLCAAMPARSWGLSRAPERVQRASCFASTVICGHDRVTYRSSGERKSAAVRGGSAASAACRSTSLSCQRSRHSPRVGSCASKASTGTSAAVIGQGGSGGAARQRRARIARRTRSLIRSTACPSATAGINVGLSVGTVEIRSIVLRKSFCFIWPPWTTFDRRL